MRAPNMSKYLSPRYFGVFALIATSAGCVPAVRSHSRQKPICEVPAKFQLQSIAEDKGQPLPATTAAQQTWQELFASSDLRDLIRKSLLNNREIQLRLLDVMLAENEITARQGLYWPKVEASLNGGIEKVGKYTSQGRSDEFLNIPRNLGNLSLGLVGSWEADIWGKLRNAKKSADFTYLASIEGQRFVVTQVIAEVSRTYYELAAVDNQLKILRENICLQENTLALVKLEKQAARVTELAVQRFEADVLHYKSRAFKLEQLRVQTENRLNFLLGRYPQPVKRNAGDLLQIPPNLSVGLPADLLLNRTDVREAELALRVAEVDIRSAKAAFYPSLKIEAGVGYRAFNPAHLIATPASLVYDAVGGLVAPLLNRSVITAQFQSANTLQSQAVLRYEQTVLSAFTDVVNQMAAVSNWRGMNEILTEEVTTLSEAVTTSTVLFQAARAEYIEVLTTRRDFLEAQMELMEAKKQQYFALIKMFQALGGGWRDQTSSD